MLQQIKRGWIIVAAAATLGAASLPILAQDATDVPAASNTAAYPLNTITVSGIGTALGSPDTATLQVGVDVVDTDITAAFSQANTQIDAIIAAVREAGVAEEDIQTTNLNLYNEAPYDPAQPEQPASRYRLSNTVSVIVRDITQVQTVIESAINAGATNLYGLSFSISEPAEQERSAREDALNNARERAEQLATLVGAQLGDVLVVQETLGGYSPLAYGGAADMMQASANFVSPGQSSIQVQVQVTFALVR